MKRIRRDAQESRDSSPPERGGTRASVKVGILAAVVAFILYTVSIESRFMKNLGAVINDTAVRGIAIMAYGEADASETAEDRKATGYAPQSMFDTAAAHVYANILQEQNETLSNTDSNTKLKELDLSATKITNGGLADLVKLPKLEVLYLANNELTDTAADHLEKIKSLKILVLSKTKMTHLAVEQPKEKIPGLQIRE